MAEDKKIDCAEVDGEKFSKDLAETFVECYKSVFDIELKIDDIEKIALEIIPEDFVLCDIPEYLNKFTELVQEVVTIPNELIGALNTAITGVVTELSEKAKELANKAIEEVNEAVDQAKDAVQEKIDEVKEKIDEKKEEVAESIEEKKDEMTETLNSLKIPLEAVKYAAMGIILKRFQIIKYRCEIIQKNIMILMAKLRKKVLLELMHNKDDSGSPATTGIKSFLMTMAVVANVIAIVMGVILNIINSIVILNVDASGCCFGPTPKSLMMNSKMTVANVNGSTTAPIPQPIEKLISEAENQVEKANGEIKKANVLAMASNAAASVSGGGSFNPGSFPALPKFDGKAVRQAIALLIMTLVDAEALPRYEKLTPINIRFMVFLITGFEPAAKKTFGFPGFP